MAKVKIIKANKFIVKCINIDNLNAAQYPIKISISMKNNENIKKAQPALKIFGVLCKPCAMEDITPMSKDMINFDFIFSDNSFISRAKINVSATGAITSTYNGSKVDFTFASPRFFKNHYEFIKLTESNAKVSDGISIANSTLRK